MRMTRWWHVAALAVVVSGCGYALAGRGGSTLPAHIKRIGVPMFQNLSATPDLDRIFTDAVRKELQSRGRYTIVPDATGVDAVVTGSISSVSYEAMAFSTAQQALKYSVSVVATGEFREIKDNKVWPSRPIRVLEEFDLPSGAAVTNLASLFVQDRNALERLAEKFAKTLVASILEAF